MFYSYQLSVVRYHTENDSNANKTIRVAVVEKQREKNCGNEEWSHDNNIDEIKLALDGFR